METMILQLLSSESAPNVFLSTTTCTGQELSRKKFKNSVQIFYCPFDSPRAVRRVFSHIRPSLMIIAETEIWPNLLRTARNNDVPVFFVNGRISDDAFTRYKRIRLLLSPIFRLPELFLVQTSLDRDRFLALGARPDRVKVTGNMKFDAIRRISPDQSLIETILTHFKDQAARIFLCGSTMDGEEKILAGVFEKLFDSTPDLRIIIAPRHPERFDAVAQLFKDSGFTVARRSQLGRSQSIEPSQILVLDSLGELASIYHCAYIVFVGGTLVPTGGHNILEPAAAGKAVLVGPSMENFREILQIFKSHAAVRQVFDEQQLVSAVEQWLKHPEERDSVVSAAKEIFTRHQGATLRNLGLIKASLKSLGREQSPRGGRDAAIQDHPDAGETEKKR